MESYELMCIAEKGLGVFARQDIAQGERIFHSCDPNCYFKMHSIAVYEVTAFRDVPRGEEMTHG